MGLAIEVESSGGAGGAGLEYGCGAIRRGGGGVGCCCCAGTGAKRGWRGGGGGVTDGGRCTKRNSFDITMRSLLPGSRPHLHHDSLQQPLSHPDSRSSSFRRRLNTAISKRPTSTNRFPRSRLREPTSALVDVLLTPNDQYRKFGDRSSARMGESPSGRVEGISSSRRYFAKEIFGSRAGIERTWWSECGSWWWWFRSRRERG